MYHIPILSELRPFNTLPIERIENTLQPINGSGVSLRGIIQIFVTTNVYKCWRPLN